MNSHHELQDQVIRYQREIQELKTRERKLHKLLRRLIHLSDPQGENQDRLMDQLADSMPSQPAH